MNNKKSNNIIKIENNQVSINMNDINIINDIKNINNDILNLTNLIDKKTLQIHEENETNNKRILQYKSFMENIILEYHKICKELFKND